MESAIITAAITALIALIVAFFNSYKTTQLHISNSFVFTVTTERVKWLGHLRENISKFSSLVYDLYNVSVDFDKRDLKLVELRKVQTMLQLQLNPNDANDQKVSLLINGIFNKVEHKDMSVNEQMSELINATQSMLKAEWERVKKETQKVNI